MDSPSGGTFMGSIQIDRKRMEIKVGIFRLRPQPLEAAAIITAVIQCSD